MKIAFLTHQWPGIRIGGIGTYTRNCARALARAGHEVHVVTLQLPADADRELGPNATLHEIPHPEGSPHTGPVLLGGDLLYLLAMRTAMSVTLDQLAERHGLDIIEAPEYEALGAMCAEGKVPLITHLHSGAALARAVGNTPWTAQQAMREALELEAILGADAICAPSSAVIHDTREAYAWEQTVTEATILPLPFEPRATSFREPTPGAPILFLGRLELIKGAHVLAEAATIFLRDHPEAQLRIAGPDTMTAPTAEGQPTRFMAAWMRERWDAPTAARITFTGELTQPQIETEMANAAFVIIPSLRESYSFVACEALAAGRPVIVSDNIGATEVVADAGISFRRNDPAALAEAMSHLWTNTDLRNQLARRAWDRARTELSTENALNKRIAFYQQVIDRRKKEGTQRVRDRLISMPEVQDARINLVLQLRDGHLDNLEESLALAQVPHDLHTPGMRVLETLENLHRPKIQFHLYGAGRHTARLLLEKSRWEEKGHHAIALIDDHARFANGGTAYDLPVISLKTAEQTLTPTDIVILSTDAFEDQFWQQSETLRTRGVTVCRLYS